MKEIILSEETIEEIIKISKVLTEVNIPYEVQEPLFFLVQEVYSKENWVEEKTFSSD